MTYAAQLPDSAFQAAAATTIVTQRANLDRTATQEWIEHLEPGPFGDTAAQVYITSSKGNDSNDLVPLAATIIDDAKRREALLHIMDRSPGELSRHLIENPILSDADRAFLENAQF
ncbi:MAG: hypothetical protein KDN22_14860 [Verrucomicrobiae bacterium]|nr:hypothetical protein [Verrucomicrobiae bacterium]